MVAERQAAHASHVLDVADPLAPDGSARPRGVRAAPRAPAPRHPAARAGSLSSVMISPSTRIDGREFEKRYSASAPRAEASSSRRSRPPVQSRRRPRRHVAARVFGRAAGRRPVHCGGRLVGGASGRHQPRSGAGGPRWRCGRPPAHFNPDVVAATCRHHGEPLAGRGRGGRSSLSTAPYSARAARRRRGAVRTGVPPSPRASSAPTRPREARAPTRPPAARRRAAPETRRLHG